MKKIIIQLFFTIGFILASFNLTYAQEKNFENSLKSTYTVDSNGNTFVQHIFRIKNLTPTYYVSKHGLRISSPSVSSIRVFDRKGDLTYEETKNNNLTNIGITFPDKLVGEGKIREFTISYQNKDLAQINGKVLEVTIPQQANPDQYSNYSVTLDTPSMFGAPARVTPEDNFSVRQDGSHILFKFDDLKGEGITAIFGVEQIFNLSLKYFLENNDPQPVLVQVALPPDTAFQKMHYQQIEPRPRKIESDEDGNWIATFYMEGNTAATVLAEAQALLTLNPNITLPIITPKPFYTAEQPFWEIRNSALKKVAAQNPTPKSIYNFVTSTLNYQTPQSIEDFERLGAAKSLKDPSQTACQEFTDLFVALARINKIPTRAVTGYAYTENNKLRPLSLVEDILHAWPEYWDEEKQLWVPTDPTWGKTTGGVDYFSQFDLNHITLAINGKSSTLPYPAGTYKTEKHNEKTIEVEFGKNFPTILPDFTIELKPKAKSFLKIPGFYTLFIRNNTGQAWYNTAFDLVAEKSDIALQSSEKNIVAILPYQTIKLPIFIYAKNGFAIQKDEVEIIVKPFNYPKKNHIVSVKNAPQFLQIFSYSQTPLILGGGFVFITLLIGSLLILRKKK